MRITIGRLTAGVALAALPAALAAQHAGMEVKHEVGVDIGFAYEHQSAIDSTAVVARNHFLIATPVDLRIGFAAGAKVVVEPRITLAFDSKGPGGTSQYIFTPDVNLLWAFTGNRQGGYATVGAGLDLEHANSQSASQFSINGGLGTRVPYESGAIRLEAFGRYAIKNAGKLLPATFAVGARIGLSLWH